MSSHWLKNSDCYFLELQHQNPEVHSVNASY